MKKSIILFLVISLMITLIAVPQASAGRRFWPGLALGVGSAIVLSHLLNPPRVYTYYAPPVPVYAPPAQYYPAPPVARDRWIPGHWVENYGPYGAYSRYWVEGHWERY
jgi:hypothetical protein